MSKHFEEPTLRLLERAEHCQFVLNGRTKKLADMDRFELLEALMNTIDVVEAIADHSASISSQLEQWQMHGKVGQ